MNMRLPKTVKQLYTLVEKCAQMEEGRKLPGEKDCINVDSEDEDEKSGPKKRPKKSAPLPKSAKPVTESRTQTNKRIANV